MHPILFSIGPVVLYSYGAMMVLGFLLTIWLAGRAARKLPPELRAISEEQVVDFTCWSLLGGIVGGRLLYVLLQWPFFAQAPLEVFALWHGGLVWYGGFFGGLLSGYGYTRAQGLNFLRVLDQFIPFGVLGHAVGRIGCFLNGCCYGKPTDLWCGVDFSGQGQRVLPTQLFETIGLSLLFLILRRLQRPALLRQSGRVFGCYLSGYGLLRFVLEFMRGDQHPWFAGLTLQQLICIIVFLAGLALIRRRDKRA